MRRRLFSTFLAIATSACAAATTTQMNGNLSPTNAVGHETPDANKIIPPTVQEIERPQIGIMNSNQPALQKTPGIPSPEELRKPFRPGPKPTPGIPDEKTIRRMLKKPANISNANR
jgi:hypothetical protein